MPGYKGHITGGVVVGGVALVATVSMGHYRPEPAVGGALITLAVLGALFPDVDTDSRGQNLFYGLMVILDLVLMYRGYYRWAAILGFGAMLPAIGRHRGWTHTWWAMLLVPAPIILLPMLFYDTGPQKLAPFYLAAVTGYFSHLLLDRKFR